MLCNTTCAFLNPARASIGIATSWLRKMLVVDEALLKLASCQRQVYKRASTARHGPRSELSKLQPWGQAGARNSIHDKGPHCTPKASSFSSRATKQHFAQFTYRLCKNRSQPLRTCVISKISSSSPRKSTSFWLLVTGQYLSNARSTGSASFGSFSTNCSACPNPTHALRWALRVKRVTGVT